MNFVKVLTIGIRLCKSKEDAQNLDYEKTSLIYWGSIDDLPAKYASYVIVKSHVKDNTLFLWCTEDICKIKDLIEFEGSLKNFKFFNYISAYDAESKITKNSILIKYSKELDNKKIINVEVINNDIEIYIFLDNLKSNVLEDNFNGDIEFSEV